MTKRIKLLILLISAVCVLSLCAIPAVADETETQRVPVSFTLVINGGDKIYTAGEAFNPRGFIFKVTYADGGYDYLDGSQLTYSAVGPLTPDITSVTFELQNFTQDVQITVTPAAPSPLSQIVSIDATLLQSSFYELESIDASMLNISAMLADGTFTTLDPAKCTISPALGAPLNAGNTLLKVTYSDGINNFSDTVIIDVAPILSIEISNTENAVLYEALPLGAPTGLTVTAYYDDAKQISRVVTGYGVSGDSMTVTADANGKMAITINAGIASLPLEVTVLPIVSYKITGLKDVYYYGDSVDLSAVTVKAVYSDMVNVDVTNQVVFSPIAEVKAGSIITATHNGTDLKDHIKSEFPVGTLDIITPPAKTRYEIGEIFDSTGLSVGINYSNGERRFLNIGDYTIIASSPLTAADKVVKVNYYGASANISISVGHESYITNLSIIGSPDKLNYFEGELISTSGLIIKALLSDGTEVTIDPQLLTFSPSLDTPLTTDITSITISANEMGTDKYCFVHLPITVQKREPTALAAIAQPTKLLYVEGETFDPDGLALQLFFNDQTSIVPSSFYFRPALGSPIILDKSAESKLIIHAVYEYEGKEFTYPIEITVIPSEVENLLISRNPVKTVYEIGESFDPSGIELLLIYKDRALIPQTVPSEYYTFSPAVITAETRSVVFEFRGLTVELPISVIGSSVTTPPVNTDPITTDPITTTTPDNTTDQNGTDQTTADSDDITDPPETPGVSDITTSPDYPSTSDSSTTEPGDDDDKSGFSLLTLWIIIIIIIIAMLIALIIYYKRNFT